MHGPERDIDAVFPGHGSRKRVAVIVIEHDLTGARGGEPRDHAWGVRPDRRLFSQVDPADSTEEVASLEHCHALEQRSLKQPGDQVPDTAPVSYTHLRAHET